MQDKPQWLSFGRSMFWQHQIDPWQPIRLRQRHTRKMPRSVSPMRWRRFMSIIATRLQETRQSKTSLPPVHMECRLCTLNYQAAKRSQCASAHRGNSYRSSSVLHRFPSTRTAGTASASWLPVCLFALGCGAVLRPTPLDALAPCVHRSRRAAGVVVLLHPYTITHPDSTRGTARRSRIRI